jgi:RimJ/RimL family protein N-acetyltransferase
MNAAPQPCLMDLRLRGQGLTLRPVTPEDAAAAYPLIHEHGEVTRWLVWRGPVDEASLAETYGEWRAGGAAGANYRLAIETPEDGFVGAVSLRFEGHPFVGDVGYWIGSPYWNRGLGTEANRLLAWLAFEHLATRALTATVFLGNGASARLLEKVGYVCETDANGQALVGRATELDRESWTFGMSRLDFLRARGEWEPAEARVELE